MVPASVRAGVFGGFWSTLQQNLSTGSQSASASGGNLQTLALLKPAMNIDPSAGRGGGDITIVDNSALLPEEGPAGTIADLVKPKNATISLYIVRGGDTLSGIAEMFGVSVNTIRWANDIPKGGTIAVGQTLTILPITSVRYTIKKGDTLAAIAKRYSGDVDEIVSYNGLEPDELTPGTEILIPGGELSVSPAPAPAKTTTYATTVGTPSQIGYYLRPIVGGTKTQGIHGYNAVDLAAPIGTPILASAEGDVIVSRISGWNGGYGAYVVIRHSNGSQTLYAHASSVIVSVGQHVEQGQVIAYVGQTGKATGPHVHFEIRGGIRNPF